MSDHMSENRRITLHRLSADTATAVTAPSSKSETNRALLLAALSPGKTTLHRCLASKDTLLMAAALRELGVSVSELDQPTTVVESSGQLSVPASGKVLFLGNAGTATRFLTAACCLIDGSITVDGDEDMRQRPIKPLVDALARIGFAIRTETESVPVEINGGASEQTSATSSAPSLASLQASITVDARQSTQFTSALMMIAPKLPNGLTVQMANPEVLDGSGYLNLTTTLMQAFGAQISSPSFGTWRIEPTDYQAPAEHAIEADYSACTYFWAANALRETPMIIDNDHHEQTLQPDAKAFDHIAQFPTMAATIDGSMIQDAVPTLAVLAAFNNSTVRFVGIKNLRVKECDRIEAVHEGLNRIRAGLATIEGDDLIVHGDPALTPDHLETTIRTFNDHRIAMSFALAGYRVAGLVIENPDCVGKTFPTYWSVMATMGLGSTPYE